MRTGPEFNEENRHWGKDNSGFSSRRLFTVTQKRMGKGGAGGSVNGAGFNEKIPPPQGRIWDSQKSGHLKAMHEVSGTRGGEK